MSINQKKIDFNKELTQRVRVLLVDDNPDIFEDLKAVLSVEQEADTEEDGFLEDTKTLSDAFSPPFTRQRFFFDIEYTNQGEDAVRLVRESFQKNDPYEMVFMDVRLPPGIDGIETISQIWSEYPHIEIIICTAFSDYSWKEISMRLGSPDNLLFIRKPFDAVTIKQTAYSISTRHLKNQKREKILEEKGQEIQRRIEQLQEMTRYIQKILRNN